MHRTLPIPAARRQSRTKMPGARLTCARSWRCHLANGGLPPLPKYDGRIVVISWLHYRLQKLKQAVNEEIAAGGASQPGTDEELNWTAIAEVSCFLRRPAVLKTLFTAENRGPICRRVQSALAR